MSLVTIRAVKEEFSLHANTDYRVPIPDRGQIPGILRKTNIEISAAGTTKGLTLAEFDAKTKDLSPAERRILIVKLYFDKVLRADGR